MFEYPLKRRKRCSVLSYDLHMENKNEKIKVDLIPIN